MHPERVGIGRIDTTQKLVFGKAEEMSFCVHLNFIPQAGWRRQPGWAAGRMVGPGYTYVRGNFGRETRPNFLESHVFLDLLTFWS